MAQQVSERKADSTETAPQPNYRLLLLNDAKNTFDFVEHCLKKYIPGMSSDKAHQLTTKAHSDGVALVWTGPREVGELYFEQLKNEGLHMALEPDA